MIKFLDGRVTREVTIYALCEPDTGEVRYVGKTVEKPARRLVYHLNRAKSDRRHLPSARWIFKRSCEGKRPIVRELEKVSENDDWASREKYWIAYFRSAGADLLNLTEGGEGNSGRQFAGSAHARKIGEALKRGSSFNCEQCSAAFYRKQRDIAKGNCRFCSRQCYFQWQVGKTKIMPPRSNCNAG